MENVREKTVSAQTKYTGHIINVRVDDVILSDNKIHPREVVEHPGGVVIVPFLDDKIILIKQWRHPVNCELMELPAGKLDKGEDPFEAAKRELEEETGYKTNNLESLGYIYTTPGFSNEKLYLYKATDLIPSKTNFDEGEFIEPFIVSIDEAEILIKEGKITDAKTIVGVLRTVRNYWKD